MNNLRYCLLIIIFLVNITITWTADARALISSISSYNSLEELVTSLERISNAQAQLLQELQKQITVTQSDIDLLRGQIQENSYQLNLVIERQKQIYQYIDSLHNSSLQEKNEESVKSEQNNDDNVDYNNAISLILKKKQYDQATIALQTFIKKYPNSIYQPNAIYWLGQLNYNRGKKDDASYYFATVVKNFPNALKSSEALYKVGVIMQDKGDNAKAKLVYLQVIRNYPNTEAAKQAQKRIINL